MPNMKKNMLMMTPAERAAMAKMQMMEGSMIQPVMMAKAGKEVDNSAFAKLAPPYDKATYADKIAGATKKMKGGPIGGMPNEEYKKRGEVKAMRYYGGGSTYGRRRS